MDGWMTVDDGWMGGWQQVSALSSPSLVSENAGLRSIGAWAFSDLPELVEL